MMTQFESIRPILKLNLRLSKSSLCDYKDAHTFIKRIIIVIEEAATNVDRATDRNNKQAIFKNCAPFTDCNTHVENAKDLDFVMLMLNYSHNYSWKSASLYHLCRYDPKNPIRGSASFRFKLGLLDNTDNADIINAEIAVP